MLCGISIGRKAARPDLLVTVAAYGDYAPWYIGTAIAYEQGGYETGPSASNVAPEVEAMLMGPSEDFCNHNEFGGGQSRNWFSSMGVSGSA